MRYVGVDHHKNSSYLSMMNEKGIVTKEGRINNTKGSLRNFLNGEVAPDSTQAVLEAGRNWTVMYDWLEQEVDRVRLAHPAKVKAIAEAKIKTDKIDAGTLAHLLRSDLLPEAYVPSNEARQAKNILHQRMFFVRVQTMVKNRIHGIVDRHPEIRTEFNETDLFGKQGKQWLRGVKLPQHSRRLLDQELKLLEAVGERIKASDYRVKRLGKADTWIKRLKTIPGIGRFFATLITHEIDDVNRFRNEKKLHAYVGLIPSTYASGSRVFYGRITKHGNKSITWALVEAVWPATRKDLGLRMYYERLRRRKGANAAKVATPRRLLTIVYRVLKKTGIIVQLIQLTPAALIFAWRKLKIDSFAPSRRLGSWGSNTMMCATDVTRMGG